MDRLTALLEKNLEPIATRFAENKYLIALRDGLVLAMPILIIGSFCIIIGDFPIPAFQTFMTNAFPDFWANWNWNVVNPATIGLVSLLSIVGVSSSLAREEKIDPMSSVAIALSAYFILIPIDDSAAYNSSYFAAQGLFVSMITSILVVELYAFFLRKKVTIKMPDSVPSFVSTQFEALVPATIILMMFLAVRYIFAATPYGTMTEFIYKVLQIPLTNIGTSLGGTLVVSFLNSFFWLFGIHGTAVTGAFTDPIWYAARFANLEVYQKGADLARPYIVTMDFGNMFIFLGGTGITLALTFLMAFACKSQRIRQLGRMSILPGLFNVNEPVIFGLPLVLNPVMIIPFFLAPMVTILIAYGAMRFGLCPYPTGVTIPWTTPAPIGGWLMCNDWRGGLLQLIVIAVSGVIYYPFLKVLDKKYLEEEVAAENEEKKQA